MNYLLSLALNFINNPLIRSIIKNVITLLTTTAADAIPVAVEYIKEAAANSELKDSSQKFLYVFKKLEEKFPNLGTSTLNVVIETSYDYLVKSRSI